MLKYTSEMAEDLMANKVDKSYVISDVYGTITVDSCQRKISSEVLECYKFSKYVVDPNKVRFRKKVRIFPFVLVFIKRLQIKSTDIISTSENISSKRQLQKLNNLPKNTNIRRVHFRKMVFCTTKGNTSKDKCNL